VAANLFGGSRAGMVLRDDLIPGRSVRVGVIDGPLPSLPSHLPDFDCRNNRVMLAALEEIEAAVMAARRRYGGAFSRPPSRVRLLMRIANSSLPLLVRSACTGTQPRSRANHMRKTRRSLAVWRLVTMTVS